MEKFRIRYFGEVADKIGKEEEELVLQERNTRELFQLLKKQYDLETVPLKITVNMELIEEDQAIKKEDEIAVLSPFAGG